ncbi:sensor histidine kinase [Cohnella lupini]|uniref:Two-component system sensor histidine kinase YesM n=1 Tax=Cohnella lupini TaxID=1294267 RepID=A0A3D9IPZ3_9BACL|nr:sensor histidine kinase [Cohnella lupini]RED63860.1 two-component system sensor histidine kinase YesM [Cohnella lupini]
MKRNRPIFIKINGVILLLVILIAILYAYFSQTSFKVIDTQITANNESQLSFLKKQVESNVERLSLSSTVLVRDSSILDLQKSILLENDYERINFQRQVKEKLNLQSFSSNWSNHLSVYLPDIQIRISTNPGDGYDPKDLDKANNGTWELHYDIDRQSSYYQLFIWDPYFSKNTEQTVNAIYEARFGVDNIREMLRQYKPDRPGYSFLLTSSGKVFSSSANDDVDYEALGASLLREKLSESGHKKIKLDKQKTYLSYIRLPSLDAYLVNYVPLNVIHAPMIVSRNLFYLSLVILVFLGFGAAYLLYLNVQKPISYIVKGLKQFEIGNHSYRINRRFHNEFDYMMLRFNDMGSEIQHLIDNVYAEQNRSRLATLKQLQSQINPHFLYNCLSFIAGCAKAGYTDTIQQMTYHLGDYYRYTTRVENQMPLLKEEVELVHHYLKIYALRLERIDYRIQIPPEMLNEPIMRLILQPVVENAIVHGVEPTLGRGRIQVTGSADEVWNVLLVEDSGAGMTEQEIASYMQSLEQPMEESTGCGLWNVNQRLKQRFGPEAGISMGRSSELSGLFVRLRWKREEGDDHDSIAAS